MKKRERIIWISSIAIIIIISIFVIFIKDAWAENLTVKSKNKPSKEILLNKFQSVLDLIEEYYVNEDKIDQEKMVNGAIDGMLKSLGDPHTEYLAKEYMDELKTTSDGKYGGVGMMISEKDEKIIVVSPMEGYPAFKKGIRAGDYIVSVDGVILKGKNTTEAANMLKGKPGTLVKIELMRADLIFQVEIERAMIDLPSVKYTVINNNYGYLRITQFAGTTSKHVKEALESFNKKKVKGIIVDLRYNPGGLLNEVIKIVNFFQKEGVIVSTIGRYDKVVNKADPLVTIVDKKIPVIVIIDNGSASASEIFAGAIKDLKRGILIGEKSFGKGSVQTIYPLGSGGDGVKITIAKYYTPGGKCIDGIGIEPDIEVKEPELTKDEKDSFKKLFDNKAIDNILKTNSDPDNEELEKMVDKLLSDGYKLPRRYLKKLLKNSAEIDNQEKEIYDLEYDLQLKKTIELFDKKIIKMKKDEYYIDKKNK